jgi:hypothetical protein
MKFQEHGESCILRDFIIGTVFTNINVGLKTNEGEMGGVQSIHEEDQKHIKNFGHKICRQDPLQCLTLPLVPWSHNDPSPFLTHVFVQTVTNTDIAFYVFYRKPILTMSHTFASFCVFPFIFYLFLFPLGVKKDPMVPPMLYR